jgi:hypothetical protein
MMPLRIFRTVLATVALAGLLMAPVSAKPPEGKGKPDKVETGRSHGNPGKGKSVHDGAGKERGKGDADRDAASLLVSAGITLLAARQLAQENGIVGYAGLPPGIRKNLERGKPLPPGIAKKLVPAPVLARLPVHPGYTWYSVGSDLVLVAAATMVVADVLDGVFD